ncbi:hypothetical protein [Streptosporangium minutum]|uniref:Uncharacterized protein n=1 Tax=Streptosporangium minutum TaxID=569862 RepID=A0A243RVL0_9ACTN|nr:hypothetical protein [Streptosporangium minutum]OUC98413.1 hypothetical protein CA984_07160 [Streptosporangium minutum]
MKRFIAGLACATATALVPPAHTLPAPAQASTVSFRAADPANALRQQFRAGRGVRVTETVRLGMGKGTDSVRREGVLRFSPSGIVAADFVRRVTSSPPRKNDSPIYVQHMISVGGKYYHRDVTPADDYLPEGKRWVRAGIDRPSQKWGTAFGDQFINVFEPATLEFLLRTSTHRLPGQGGTQYRGTITEAELYKVSRSFRERTVFFAPDSKRQRAKITWRLWTDDSGLVTRLVTGHMYGYMFDDSSSDTRYSGWGSTVTVAPPPADQVVDEDDVDYSTRSETPRNVARPDQPGIRR